MKEKGKRIEKGFSIAKRGSVIVEAVCTVGLLILKFIDDFMTDKG